MSEFYEIAYAVASRQLCLFTGTGFSKAVSGNTAPSWQGLLEAVCAKCDHPDLLKETLFPAVPPNPLALEEAAQVIAIELERKGLSIHQEIADLIKPVSLVGANQPIADFFAANSFRVVTTNYDKLVEQLCGEARTQSLTPGLPVPRMSADVKVYHVHGSVDVPDNMVVTSEDYFRFINGESYFSRKLSTVLHENAVVILGYSLGDTNLKAIISDYKGFARSQMLGSNIFLVSREKVAGYIKDYYAHCYGIRVLDGIEIYDFFAKVNAFVPEAQKNIEKSLKNIGNVIHNDYHFVDNYLQRDMSFYEIISSLGAAGLSIKDPRVVQLIGKIIKRKDELAHAPNEWHQYEHLARWLIYLANILELVGSSIEETYLSATLVSMNSMGRPWRRGYSWAAYGAWTAGWSGIIAANRVLIKKHILEHTDWPDALAVVSQG